MQSPVRGEEQAIRRVDSLTVYIPSNADELHMLSSLVGGE